VDLRQVGRIPGMKVVRQSDVDNQRGHRHAEDSIAQGVQSGLLKDALIYDIFAKTLSFFRACCRCSIDFREFVPILGFKRGPISKRDILVSRLIAYF
jgi:hypothetical protein